MKIYVVHNIQVDSSKPQDLFAEEVAEVVVGEVTTLMTIWMPLLPKLQMESSMVKN